MTLNMRVNLDATEIQRLEKTEPYQHLIISRKCTTVCDEASLQYYWIDGLKAQMTLKVIF
jgi:hypothetical protein